jgi:hypothetical protein
VLILSFAICLSKQNFFWRRKMLRSMMMLAFLVTCKGFTNHGVSRFSSTSLRGQMKMMARKKKEMPANPVAVVTG